MMLIAFSLITAMGCVDQPEPVGQEHMLPDLSKWEESPGFEEAELHCDSDADCPTGFCDVDGSCIEIPPPDHGER
jgi:hypothetical protein